MLQWIDENTLKNVYFIIAIMISLPLTAILAIILVYRASRKD